MSIIYTLLSRACWRDEQFDRLDSLAGNDVDAAASGGGDDDDHEMLVIGHQRAVTVIVGGARPRSP